MSYIESTPDNASAADIYYEEYGNSAKESVVLIHGWPLSGQMWEYQVNALLEAGYHVVTYDRRGFGRSEKPADGYDYDTFADDLAAVLEALDLKNVTVAGFSMGGGEVARYIGNYGTDRIKNAMLISAVTPYMLKTDDNPDGAPQDVFDEMMAGVKEDRIAFLDEFGQQFVNWDDLGGDHVSEDIVNFNKQIASFASGVATQRCITAFAETDFRDDLESFDVPTLIVHGEADQVVPLDVSAKRADEMIADSQLEVIENAPHGLNYTHTEKLNELMISFLG